ncbi:MAG: YafY family protein [Chloroflexota bacterium]
MRADRLISILLQLQTHERMTASELAKRLEVSERTIHRDMEALSFAGFPVYAERGVGGGWSLMEGYETNFTALNEAEIQTIFLSKPNGVLSDLGLDNAAETALHKLMASLPSTYRRDAEYYQQRIHIDVSRGHNTDDELTFLPLLQEAVWQERQIQTSYQLSTGPLIQPLLQPLGLVAKGSIWYLVAAFDEMSSSSIGVYRVSNVQDVQLLDTHFVRPEAFDLTRFWEKSSAEFASRVPPYRVEARVLAEIAHKFERPCSYFRADIQNEADEGCWVQADFYFDSKAAAFDELVAYGTQIEVISPMELRNEFIAHALEMFDMYQKQQPVLIPNRIQLKYGDVRRLAA